MYFSVLFLGIVDYITINLLLYLHHSTHVYLNSYTLLWLVTDKNIIKSVLKMLQQTTKNAYKIKYKVTPGHL